MDNPQKQPRHRFHWSPSLANDKDLAVGETTVQCLAQASLPDSLARQH